MTTPQAATARRPSILLVDDEPTIRLVLRRYFARAGWDVDDAEDGAGALAKLFTAGAAYQVVLCDLHMPGISGADVYRRLSDDAPEWLERLVLASGNINGVGPAPWLSDSRCTKVEKPFELGRLLGMAKEIAARASEGV